MAERAATGPRDAAALAAAERNCCCSRKPQFAVMMTVPDPEPRAVELLLCGQHFRFSWWTVRSAGATVFDRTGSIVGAAPWDMA